MTKQAQKPYWFPAKKYGYGWGFPCSWQGWAVMALFFVAVACVGVFLNPVDHTLGFILGIVCIAVGLTSICYLKGEPARWRWG